jgi:hypothetical protein
MASVREKTPPKKSAAQQEFPTEFVAEEKKRPTESDAEKKMWEAILFPDANAEIVHWAKGGHSEVPSHLARFANLAIDLADQSAERYDSDNPDDTPTRDTALRERAYDLAKKVLQLAEELEPDSPDTQRLLAKTDEFDGRYETAHQRLSRLIDSVPGGDEAGMKFLFFCHQLRERTTFLSIEKLPAKTIASNKKVLDRLREAKTDVDFCNRYVARQRFVVSGDQPFKEYHVWQDAAGVTLRLAEVELELSHATQAADYFQQARRMLTKVRGLAHDLKQPEPNHLEAELQEGMKRLSAPEASPAVTPSTPPADTR